MTHGSSHLTCRLLGSCSMHAIGFGIACLRVFALLLSLPGSAPRLPPPYPCQRRLHPPDRVSTCSPCCLQEPHRDEPLGLPPCSRSCWPWLVLVLLASICPPPGSLLAKGSLLASPLALPLYSFCALPAPSRAASGASRVVPPSHSPFRDLSPMPRHRDSAPLRRLE